MLAIGLLACLLFACALAFYNYFLLFFSAGRDGEGQPESNPLAKNVVLIAQNCSETQISFARGAVNPLGKNVVSIAQNCSKTQISFNRGEPSRYQNVVSIAQNCNETQISFARGQPFRYLDALGFATMLAKITVTCECHVSCMFEPC